MPLTLYRYILRELVRVLLLSVAVLVVLVGFAVAIKPLSDGLLGPWGLVKFVLYTIPTVLGFVLPFAVAFSGVMVFCRMAQDNEILACRASGMSYPTILLPVFVLGLALTLLLFYLSNWVVPSFYLLAERQLEKDLTRILVTQVNKREALVQDRFILYADHAEEVVYRHEDAPDPQGVDGAGDLLPSRLIRLDGVAVAVLSREGNLRHEAVAERADVAIYRVEGDTWASIRLRDLMFYDTETLTDAGGPRLVTFGTWDMTPQKLPNLFKDQLQFLSWPKLQKLGRQPERFDQVRERKRQLAGAIAAEDLLRRLEAELSAGKTVALRAPFTGERYTLAAPRVERVEQTLRLEAAEGEPIRADHGRGRRTEADAGTLVVRVNDEDTEPTAQVELTEATVYDLRDTGAPRERLKLPSLQLDKPLLAPLLARHSDELMALAREEHAAAPRVAKAGEGLRLSIAKLGRKVMSRLHERAASAVGCLLVLLLACLLSFQMRGTMPLVIYFWTFLIATLAVILARSGENVATDTSRGPVVGYLVIWSGCLLTAAALLPLYLRLRKH